MGFGGWVVFVGMWGLMVFERLFFVDGWDMEVWLGRELVVRSCWEVLVEIWSWVYGMDNFVGLVYFFNV